MPVTAELGEPLIVGDPEFEDLYIADLMKLEPHTSIDRRNPIVLVRFVLRCPIQHAILWTDVPLDVPAVQEGVICRLHYFRKASAEDLRRFNSYTESLTAAQEERLEQARREGDQNTVNIILHHQRGEYTRTRVLLTYRRWEL